MAPSSMLLDWLPPLLSVVVCSSGSLFVHVHLPSKTERMTGMTLFPSIISLSGTSSRRKSCELFGFADASTEAIVRVIYMRITDEKNAAHVSFVFTNSKVAPRSATSVPRLELCVAVEAS